MRVAPARRVAAVDCGTNTVRLLVADLADLADDAATRLRPVVRETRIVRLGEGVDRTGRLSDAALQRLAPVLGDYRSLLDAHGVGPDALRVCATSATRDAANRDHLVALVRDHLGIDPEVVDGDEEARLAFTGAARGGAGRWADPVLVVDVGGGSTELVLGRDGVPVAWHSMDVGGVRLHERHRLSDPPADGEVAAVLRDVDAALDRAARDVAVADAGTVVAVAATALTLAAAVVGLDHEQISTTDGVALVTDDLLAAVERLVPLTVAARRDLPYVATGRADVIGAGALVLAAVVGRTGAATFVASVADVLDGIAWSVLDRAQPGTVAATPREETP